MAQDSVWPERKHCSHPPGAWRQRSDRVDAAVDRPQAPIGRAALHGGLAHTGCAQLASGDDAMLATRKALSAADTLDSALDPARHRARGLARLLSIRPRTFVTPGGSTGFAYLWRAGCAQSEGGMCRNGCAS